MSHNRNHRDISLTYDQRILLDMYHNFYNHTSRQIDSLYELQNEIRESINQIVGLGERYNDRNYNSNYNSNSRPHRSSAPRTQPTNGINLDNSQSRIFYIDGVPYLLDLSHIWRRPATNTNTNTTNNTRSFYENVLIAPSQNQIENATRIVCYSDIENPMNSSCPITMDQFVDDSSVTQILQCGHLFTPSGIDSWLRTSVRCPVCRYDIRDYRAPPISNESSTENTRETRRQTTEPGDDEEDQHQEQPVTNSRNSNNRNSRRGRHSTRSYSNNNINIENAMSTITEELLNSIFTSNNRTTSILDPSLNSLFYDSSSNHYIFEGFLRR